MKTWKAINVLGVFLLLGLVSGCSPQGETYGEPISSDMTLTKVGAILSDPDRFADKLVKVEGEIVRECPTGCWFDLKDDTALIHVDIKPSGLAIAQKVGHQTLVEGTVKKRHGRTVIVGKGVKVK